MFGKWLMRPGAGGTRILMRPDMGGGYWFWQGDLFNRWYAGYQLLNAVALVVALVVAGQLRADVEDPAGGFGKPEIGGPVSPDGKVEVSCDLPVEMRHRNRGGRDGLGLCVFASIDHAALYQNDEKVIGLFQKMFKEPGGGYPAKVRLMMDRYCKGARYLQYEGKDPSVLELALKTGRMPAVTYGPDHMVSLVYLDSTWAAVLDNNFVGEREIRWFKREEFLRVWRGNGNGWAVVLLHCRPPAPPRNFK